MNPVLRFAVTPEQWQQAKAAVEEKFGLALADGGGTHESSTKGITFGYSYDGSVFTLQVEKRSWYDPSVDTIDQDVIAALLQLGATELESR